MIQTTEEYSIRQNTGTLFIQYLTKFFQHRTLKNSDVTPQKANTDQSKPHFIRHFLKG